MLFSSPIFLFMFLPLCLIAYYATGRNNLVLLAASLLFYAWGEPVLVLVMVWSIILNYLCGLCIGYFGSQSGPWSRVFLVLGLLANILLLIYYKYFNFLAEIINPVLPFFHIQQIGEVHIPILLGVSFFTFQAMSYLIDVARRDYPAQKNILKFALFKTLFPQLIAGPIVRYDEVGHQVSQREHSWSLFAEGTQQFIVGLAKKILIADVLALSVDKMFAVPGAEVSASVAWSATLLFALQIYFDFSGYTDMALGLGKMFGFQLPQNFNYPYSAQSVQDFWRRWHMTLSRWFRDYLYIPLGGNRHGGARTVMNLMTVFLLCGLWHGANATFILWGLLHGMFLVLERTRFGTWLASLPRPARHVYVLLVILGSWMVFRAESLTQVHALGAAMLGANGWHRPLYGLDLYTDNLTWLSCAGGILFSFPVGNWVRAYMTRRSPGGESAPRVLQGGTPVVEIGASVAYGFLLLVCVAFVGEQTHNAFIYFRF